MFDRKIQLYTQTSLIFIGNFIKKFLNANQITFIGFIFGVLMCISILYNNYNLAIIFLLLNRSFDGLDGVVARLSTPTPLGGFLDIVFDFIIYSGFVLAFGLSSDDNTLVSMILIFSFICTGTTFLAKSAINSSMKLRLNATEIPKSFYYSQGIVEGFETTIYMLLCLIFPKLYIFFSIIFIIMCLITTFSRVVVTYKELS